MHDLPTSKIRPGPRRYAVWLVVALLLSIGACSLLQPERRDARDITRWQHHAQRVRILRDEWGIPHVYGESDADAVFGLIYAQAEDDFPRIERNYLAALGRLAEAEGRTALFADLRTRLFIDHDELRALHSAAPEWLRELTQAWADGLNYFLHTHPAITARVITRYEPWMTLAFSEGSITSDVLRVSPEQVESFYASRGSLPIPAPKPRPVKDGSNAIAVAPSRTADGHALLLINPHTSFQYRTEAHVCSDEGLHAYGAATWGQFFLFQGFNERLGWAHTTSGVDAVDEYLETVVERAGAWHYRHDDALLSMQERDVVLACRDQNGVLQHHSFTTLHTHHGPVIREQDGHWVTVALMQRPVEALQLGVLRMKARDLDSFRNALELRANSTNNTIFADADGNILFQPAQFVPRRQTAHDFRLPVDGSDPTTDWDGVHALDEAPFVLNPTAGWIQNTNNWPFSVAGPDSPKASRYPSYMDTFGENPRGLHAVALLEERSELTLIGLRDLAYDPGQPAMAQLLPGLLTAYDAAAEPLRTTLREPVAVLRAWDHRWAIDSVATTLAVLWGNEIWERTNERIDGVDLMSEVEMNDQLVAVSTPTEKLASLAAVVQRLEAAFGSWRTAWGDINRLQRPKDGATFVDTEPSLPVGFTESWTGSLATFGTESPEASPRHYGVHGNSFVAVVAFADPVRALAIRPWGQSGDPKSPNFTDQSAGYAEGRLRAVHFERRDVEAHARSEYHPGN